jgi:hypothetical protein
MRKVQYKLSRTAVMPYPAGMDEVRKRGITGLFAEFYEMNLTIGEGYELIQNRQDSVFGK